MEGDEFWSDDNDMEFVTSAAKENLTDIYMYMHARTIITILYCRLEFPIVVYFKCYFLNNAALSIRPAQLWPYTIWSRQKLCTSLTRSCSAL